MLLLSDNNNNVKKQTNVDRIKFQWSLILLLNTMIYTRLINSEISNKTKVLIVIITVIFSQVHLQFFMNCLASSILTITHYLMQFLITGNVFFSGDTCVNISKLLLTGIFKNYFFDSVFNSIIINLHFRNHF